MKTVFFSGSRSLNRLNEELRARIDKVVDQGFYILVGDANGADKAIQKYLASTQYGNVYVFHSGDTIRNNIGSWNTCAVNVDSRLKGRDFYTAKDKEMARRADYGFVIWNGQSTGSINNVVELLQNDKASIIYVSPMKRFFSIKGLKDFENFTQHLPSPAYLTAKKSLQRSSISGTADMQTKLPL